MAAAQQLLRAVKIGQYPVQKARPLDQAGFEFAPFGGRNQERDGIQIPRAVHAQRIAVNVVGDAVFADALPRGFPAARQFFARRAPKSNAI